jgi:glutamate dehydrogenase/leucine dehydrogenase
MQIFERNNGGDFERLIFVQDRSCGLQAIVALHHLRRGPAFGGVRRASYPDQNAALDDVIALAAAMSRKLALANMPAGGGKTVILQRPDTDLERAYMALGAAIEGMNGDYFCGPDIGTGERELDWLRRTCSRVNPRGNDAGRSTALGVLAGLRGLLRVLQGSPNFAGLRVGIEGLGQVGSWLGKRLVEAGAEVWAHDIDPQARERGLNLGLKVVSQVDELLRAELDVLMPCAVGGTVNESIAESLAVRAICGCANNPLTSPRVAQILHRRNIVMVPDFVVNAGAVIEGVITQGLFAADSSSDAARVVDCEIAAIEDRCFDLLERAKNQGADPLALALSRADQILGRSP